MDNKSEAPKIEQACTWLCLLLDCNYTQLLMTSQLHIHEHLIQCLSNVTAIVSIFDRSL